MITEDFTIDREGKDFVMYDFIIKQFPWWTVADAIPTT